MVETIWAVGVSTAETNWVRRERKKDLNISKGLFMYPNFVDNWVVDRAWC